MRATARQKGVFAREFLKKSPRSSAARQRTYGIASGFRAGSGIACASKSLKLSGSTAGLK